MAINFHPKPGQILLCDFSLGFKKPEMVKNKRPVIVLIGSIKGRADLVSIVPLSTKEPRFSQPYHCKLPKSSLPMLKTFQISDSWIKGDMIYTVGFYRLNLILLGTKKSDGKRQYFTRKLDHLWMKQVHQCVLHGLDLGRLARYL